MLTVAACSNDNLEGGKAGFESNKGEVYMTMNISAAGAAGSRTDTPNQGSEVGKDGENKVTSALVVFAKEDDGDYTVFKSCLAGDVAGSSTEYMATFKLEREILLDDVKDKPEGVTYHLFVIANPTEEIIRAYETPGGDVQTTFSLKEDADTYWTPNHFLMSNADLAYITIKEEDVTYGKHTTSDDPFKLGKVNIQRAMSRFDIDLSKVNESKDAIEFNAENNNSTLKKVTVKFDAMALVNMAQEVNMFKVMAKDPETLAGKTISFEDERNGANAEHYVFSPDQNCKWTYPLFDNLTTGSVDVPYAGDPKDFATFFQTEGSYVTIGALTESDEDNDFTHPGTTPSTDGGKYYIWRYCMENTNYDLNNQLHGNSTGIVFRAEITGENVTGEEALYAYNSVILGNAEALKTYATSPQADDDDAGIYDAVKIKYADAVSSLQAEKGEWTLEDGDLAELDAHLVEKGFSIYRPDDSGKFYCYYTYWNRHNDNGPDMRTIMGIMEFATVRNNIYKLSITKVNRLGHPGKPEDDPDPEDPNDPDEEDEFYCEISCVVLDWEVRMNDVEF